MRLYPTRQSPEPGHASGGRDGLAASSEPRAGACQAGRARPAASSQVSYTSM
jgi:hypothetical protein